MNEENQVAKKVLEALGGDRETTTAAGGLYGYAGLTRERPWDELSAFEKIERLHLLLRAREKSIQRLHEMLARLMNHQHGPNGELLAPLGFFGGQACGSNFDPLA